MVAKTANNTASLKFSVANGKILDIKIPNFIDREAAFILGVRKSGSTLLNTIIFKLCQANKIPLLAIPQQAFAQNIPFGDWSSCEQLKDVFKDGAFYNGFRALPECIENLDLFYTRKKILLVRDPRDAIVSQYFSTAYSHSLPKENTINNNGIRETILQQRVISQQQSLDEYVLQKSVGLRNTISKYLKIINFPQLKIYRYEDVILSKRPWIKDIAQFLSLELSDELLDTILADVDIIPGKEKSTQFVRKVIPGDYKEKLQSNTIEELNKLFIDILEAFSY